MRTTWTILAVVAVVIVGILSGVTSLLFAPIIGGIALVAIIVWLVMRAAKHEPPIR